jgi:protein TonB
VSGRLRLAPALLAAVVLNVVLLASAALLSRERPLQQDMSDPVAVSLVTIRETAPPPEPEPREIPRPEPKPQLDFQPELMPPNLGRPDLPGLEVDIDPGLFTGGPERGEFIFNSGDLDQPPQAVVRTQPVYPYRARQRGISGEVRVKLLVTADGRVEQVQILEADPPGLFDDAVLQAVPRWKFQPGVIDGRQVPAWVVTSVRFDLER